MYYRSRTKGKIGSPVPPVVQTYNQPPSVGGINAVDSLAAMPPQDCLYTYNLMPSEYGLRLRKGAREWATGLPSACKSLIPFEGQFADSSTDRLWAVCAEGIYNVTLFGTTNPTQEVSFSVNTTGEAGYGVSTEFTVDDGNRFLYYADGENGLWQYDEASGMWGRPTFVGAQAGFNVETVAYVFAWKNRIWLIMQDRGDAWYSGLNAIGGTVTKFTFGSKFNHGGELKALYSWTIDGGEGVDDYLVALSRGGDVLVYKGSDPVAPDFGLTGSFFIGEVPESRRLGVNYAGELYLLSIYGLTSLRDLLQGVDSSDIKVSPSAKISRFLRQEVQDNKDAFTWQLTINPSDGFLQIISPFGDPKDATQYAQNLLTRAWGMWRGLGINCASPWNANYFLGGVDNNVFLHDGTLDRTTIQGAELWVDSTQDVGAGWSEPSPLVYSCDGTQVTDTELTIQTVVPAKDRTYYDVTYTVTNYVSGRHSVRYGSPESKSPWRTGDGTFNTQLEAIGVSSLAGVVGDTDFVGDISEVSLRRSGTLGAPIEFETLTSFQAPNGDQTSSKRVGIIRTIGYVAGTAALNIRAVYDYELEKRARAPATNPVQGFNLWNRGSWDQDLWDYGTEGVSFPQGALGMGRVVAVAVRGSSSTRLTILGWDISYTIGGFL